MNVFGQTSKLPRATALGGWVRAVAARFTRVKELRGVQRAEFEQIARDLSLAPPELYGLLTGRRLSADALEKRLLTEFELSPLLAKRLRSIEQEHLSARIRASMPIGPSCC